MKLVDGNVARKVRLVHTAKEAQKITQSRPHAFIAAGMTFIPAVAIGIARSFLRAVTDRDPLKRQRVVAIILVGVNQRIRLGDTLDKRTEHAGFGIQRHPQPYLPTLAPNHAQHRRALA